jgi:hypothetical protein
MGSGDQNIQISLPGHALSQFVSVNFPPASPLLESLIRHPKLNLHLLRLYLRIGVHLANWKPVPHDIQLAFFFHTSHLIHARNTFFLVLYFMLEPHLECWLGLSLFMT